MEALIEVALRRAAEDAGMVDVDAITLDVFAEARGLAKIENGEVTGANVAIATMREAKPTLFKESDWANLDDRQFIEREAELRSSVYAPGSRERPNFSGLDAGRLNENELFALRRHLAGVSDSGDDAVLEDACARLGVAA